MKRKQVEWLQRELRAWQKEGLVGGEQAQKILARPSYTEALSGAPSRKLNRLFAVLGALLVGTGSILFFSSNWREIPDEGKLALIFGGMVGVYALAYRMKFRERSLPGLAAGLFLLGGILYGSGIFLVAQMYNFHVDWRTGVLWWFLGTLPLAYAVDSRPVLWLSLGALVFWLSSEVMGPGMLLAHGTLGAVLVLVAVRHWQALGLPRFAKIHFSLGSGLILYSTLLLTFDSIAEELARADLEAKVWRYEWTLLAIYAAVLVGLIVSGRKGLDKPRRWLLVLLTAALAPGLLLVSGVEPGSGFLVFVNLLLFGECVGLIVFGVSVRTGAYVNLGVVFFLTLVVSRYFDQYWEYLPRSLFFIFGGVLLLGLGYVLEKKRRQWIAKFSEEAA